MVGEGVGYLPGALHYPIGDHMAKRARRKVKKSFDDTSQARPPVMDLEVEELLVLYESYRMISREVVSRLVDGHLPREALQEAARALGIERDGVLVFRDEDEQLEMLDLALFDVRMDGMTAVEATLASDEDLGELEVTILEAMTTARTSLYSIRDASWPVVDLEDVLGGRDVRLVNRSMSITVPRGSLVFLRVVTMPELSMGSGTYLAFPGGMRRTLLSRFRAVEAGIPSDDPNVRRFAAFAALHEAYGIESMTID